MAKQFFKNFPEMQYKLDSGKLITIKDNTNDTIFWTGQVTAIGSNFLEFIGLFFIL